MKKAYIGLVTAGATALVAGVGATPAHATAPKYTYSATAGATSVQAVGMTVNADPTAFSKIAGASSASRRNTILSAKAGSLLSAGAATTSTTATTNSGGGVTVVAHARTAGVSLLGGLVKARAVDTTAKIVADGTHTPKTSMTTRLIGLTVNGKSYNADLKPNTGLRIPGVLSIGLNAQQKAANKSSAVVFGDGLRVTVLNGTKGVPAGATAQINPIAEILQPGRGQATGYPLGGSAYGTYVHAKAGSTANVESGRTGYVVMPTNGSNGNDQTNATARANLTGVLSTGAVQGTQNGVRSDALSQAKERASVAHLNLFGGLISAKAIESRATQRVTPKGASHSGGLTFVGLRIAGKSIPLNVKPNTRIKVPNLGAVTINQQDAVGRAGFVHGFRTIGLHIVLSTKRAGLPAGAQVEVATSQAVVWH